MTDNRKVTITVPAELGDVLDAVAHANGERAHQTASRAVTEWLLEEAADPIIRELVDLRRQHQTSRHLRVVDG